MSKNKSVVPDAWDDDWESQADKSVAEPPSVEPEVKLSKAQRKAQHDAANRQLWEDADEVKEKPLFLQTQGEPAFKTEFKPTMKVLARKPPPKIAARGDGAAGGMANLKLEDDEDSDEEDRKKAAIEFEERKARAIREREEKQRRYQEVREKLFGSQDSTRPASSSGGNDASSRNSSRGKGRGGRQDKESRGSGSNDQSPARPNNQRRQLYDPNYTEKPTSQYAQRKANADSGRSTPNEERPIRAPRGPDGSGRGGFGFALRGGKTSNIS